MIAQIYQTNQIDCRISSRCQLLNGTNIDTDISIFTVFGLISTFSIANKYITKCICKNLKLNCHRAHFKATI